MEPFIFRQFSVHQEANVMKVGTDGVLHGAWATLPREGSILDIGTGTGLIALMAAQRSPRADVVGIDVSNEAVRLARRNVAASPFAARVDVVCRDVLDYCPEHKFDCILSNPPFFTEDTLPPDEARAMARNVSALPTDKLVAKVAQILAAGGSFSVIIPAAMMQDITALCLGSGLYMCRRTYVRTVSRKQPKRVLLTYTDTDALGLEENEIVLMEEGRRSPGYAALTRDFYLPNV